MFASLLVDNGANLEMDDAKGHTPIVWAAKQGHTRVVKFLLDHHVHLLKSSENKANDRASLT